MLGLLSFGVHAQELVEVRTKLPFTSEYQKYTVEKSGDDYVFQGDILIDVYDEDPDLELGDRIMQKALSVRGKNHLWEDNTIPYAMSPYLPSDVKSDIREAVRRLNNRTNINIIPRTDEEDYVYIIFTQSTCSSYVGKQGGRQRMKIARRCGVGSIMHEFMHAMGFYHEHCRPDRDNYISINWSNISSSWKHNYRKVNATTSVQYGPYDFRSIMHYSDGSDFDCLIPSNCDYTGNRKALSSGDILGINTLYKPLNKPAPVVAPVIVDKTEFVPVKFFTQLADDQQIEVVEVVVNGVTLSFAAHTGDKYEEAVVYLKKDQKYQYTVKVTCLEKTSSGSMLRNGTGSGTFEAEKDKSLSLTSNRRSRFGKNYTAYFE